MLQFVWIPACAGMTVVFLLARHLMRHLVCSGVFRRRYNESRSISFFSEVLSERATAIRLELDGDRKKAFSRGHKKVRRTTEREAT
jgi:hypothetical protein